jgi:hypothetical protein
MDPVTVDTADLLVGGDAIEAQDDGDSRWYVHPVTGAQYLSVTHVTGRCLGKPWLAPWAAKIAAEYAVDFQAHWQATARNARNVAIARGENPDEAARDAAVDEIKRHAARQRSLKADLGRYWHDVIEALCLDAPLPGIPQDLEGRVVDWHGDTIVVDQEWLDSVSDGFLNFKADFGSRTIAAECVVASDDHEAAGTIDLIEEFPDGRILEIDTKSGAHLGPEVQAQLGGYHAFPVLWLRNGPIVRKPRTHGAAVLHLRPSYARGYKVLELTEHELATGWQWWQQCRRQVEAGEEVAARFGHPLYPPLPDGTQPPPMVEDLTSFPGCSRAVRPLTDAGWVWLADVAVLTRADLLGIKGVGKDTVRALEQVLADYGLALAAPRRVEDLAAYGVGRVVRPLLAAGHTHLTDVAQLTRAELLAVKGLGPTAVDALIGVLDSLTKGGA